MLGGRVEPGGIAPWWAGSPSRDPAQMLVAGPWCTVASAVPVSPPPAVVSALPGGLRAPHPSLCSHGALTASRPPYSGAVCTGAPGRGPW